MQGLHSNSAHSWVPEKVGLRWALLLFSPRLALGTPEHAGATQQLCPLLGPREGRGEAPNSDSVSLFGDPRERRGYVAILPPLPSGSPKGGRIAT